MGFLGLDWNTMKQIGIAAASICVLAFNWFSGKNGATVALNLSQEDI